MIYGPVPSRRLGNSLGVNNIPPKECSYTCVYCQLGNTLKLDVKRKEYYSTEKIVSEIENHLSKLSGTREIDYITFVPDGEPTLDFNLGKTILACKKFGIKIAVITNSSLIWDKEVQDELQFADWVSLKVDTVDRTLWHKIDRPHGSLKLRTILDGMKAFSKKNIKYLVTETMLVKNLNDNENTLTQTAEFIKTLNPKAAYITIPTRPPADNKIEQPSFENINMAYQIFKSKGLAAELITGYEGIEFATTGNFRNDILNITAVHPMRKDAVDNLLRKDNEDRQILDILISEGQLIKTYYNDDIFYLRNIKNWRNNI